MIYDLRFTIYDLRFTIYDLRFAICELRGVKRIIPACHDEQRASRAITRDASLRSAGHAGLILPQVARELKLVARAARPPF
jgi:hypothetical protein